MTAGALHEGHVPGTGEWKARKKLGPQELHGIELPHQCWVAYFQIPNLFKPLLFCVPITHRKIKSYPTHTLSLYLQHPLPTLYSRLMTLFLTLLRKLTQWKQNSTSTHHLTCQLYLCVHPLTSFLDSGWAGLFLFLHVCIGAPLSCYSRILFLQSASSLVHHQPFPF